MGANVWAIVGGSTFSLPMETLLGTANQLLGMNAAATQLQYKNGLFDNSTGFFLSPSGYSFVGDPDTYIGPDGADSFAGWTGGTQRWKVSNSEFLHSTNVRLAAKLLQEDFGASIAFADGTTDIGAADGNVLILTNAAGAKTVTSLGGDTLPSGTEIETLVSISGGSVSLTHNATSLIILGNSSINLLDGDVIRWRKINDASPYWRMVGFQRGLSPTTFTAKGDLLVGKQTGSVIDAVVFPRGTDDQVLKADSTQDTGLRWGAIASPPVRQTVLSAALTAAGLCNLLSAGAALNFNVDADPTPALLTFAQGFNAGGQADAYSFLSADAANQGTLVANNINYVYATFVSPTAVTWGNGLVAPQYGYAFDRAENALLNFEGADTSTVMIDDFGNSWSAVGNAQIDTAQFKFGASSLLLDGTGDYITTNDISFLGDGSWEISCWVRFNVLPTAGNRACIWNNQAAAAGNANGVLYLFNNAGTTRLELYISGDNGSTFIVNGVTGTNTAWATATWYKFRTVFDALAGTYRVYLSVNGAAETQDQTTSSTLRMSSGGTAPSFRIGQTAIAARDLNGWVDAFRIIRAATVTATETPAATAPAVTDHKIHFFSIPAMKMYEVTAASVTPAVPPTLTAVNRLFVGECDTGAGTVTAVRNYALRGETLTPSQIGGAGLQTFTHNLGVPAEYIEAKMKFQRVATGGAADGGINYDTMGEWWIVGTTATRGIVSWLQGRNTVKVYYQGAMDFSTTTGNAVTNFINRIVAKRTF